MPNLASENSNMKGYFHASARAVAITALLTIVHAASGHAQTRNAVRADDGHTLIVWSKTPASPKGEIVLLHGRTWSARENFDLQVPGQHASTMDALVARGFAVYALDQRGYGATARDASGWLTPDRAARDAGNVADWVASHAAEHRRPALLGYSRGSATVMLAAQREPAKFSSLILYAFYYDVDNPPEKVEEPAKPPRQKTTAEAAAEDFLTPESTPPGVKEAYVRNAVRLNPIRADWRREEQFAELDPAKVTIPILVINGERDPIAKAAGLPAFFSKLESVDKWWVVLAKSDHVAHVERTNAFVSALASFLSR